ncbi:MAG: hypothetical protein L6R42_005865 [Xanthoria sp. 1 TBL-2021]|nr:MAG: hypothetical protein L6R42_005865 [Xanthoria sp. 1 TBL-2021]
MELPIHCILKNISEMHLTMAMMAFQGEAAENLSRLVLSQNAELMETGTRISALEVAINYHSSPHSSPKTPTSTPQNASPLTLFSLLLVSVVAPGRKQRDRCFNSEGLINTMDIRSFAKDFYSPPHQNYSLNPWSYRWFDHGSMRICVQNKYMTHKTFVTSDEMGNALDVIYKCCDAAAELCGGGYHQGRGTTGIFLDIETKHNGDSCEERMSLIGSQIGN